MKKDIFRQVSLERLSSPEQLDQLMRVTEPKGWVALAGLGAIAIAGLLWTVVGSLPERVNGRGILVRSGGVFEIISPTTGSITDISVRVGEVVTAGQVIARIGQEALLERLKQGREALASLEAQQRELARFGERDLALETKFLRQQRANLQQSIAGSRRALQALEQRSAGEAELVAQGLLTRRTLLATQQEIETTNERIRTFQGELTRADQRELELRSTKAEALRAGQMKLDDARRELSRLESELRMTSEVVSPYTGRVLEVMAEQGNVIDRGEPVVSVDLTGKAVKDLEAVLYVPSAHGKKLKPGMEIYIAPSTVRTEEYGYMLGKVTYVSDFPATEKGMRRVLKNAQLAATLSGDDAPYEVHADLLPDAETRSSYKWSSSRGPNVRIQSGTMASASITVARRRPISIILPVLRVSPGS